MFFVGHTPRYLCAYLKSCWHIKLIIIILFKDIYMDDGTGEPKLINIISLILMSDIKFKFINNISFAFCKEVYLLSK